MGSAKMCAIVAAENCTRGSKSCRLGQRSSPLGPPSRPSSPVTPRNLYTKVVDLEAFASGDDERCGPTLSQGVLLFLGVTTLISTFTLVQSLRNDQGICIVPRVNIWGSSQASGRPATGSESATTAPMGEVDDLEPNDTAWLLKQAEENGTTSCDKQRTTQALAFGFEMPPKGNIRLETNQVHQLHIISYTEDGTRRCSGGDFYETDLSGMNWKSRPPIKDLGDGSYLLNLLIDSRMAGLYTFKVVLLFSNLHGLDLLPEEWAQVRDVIHLQIDFIDPSIDPSSYSPITSQTELQLCTQEDFKHGVWHGRWTRAKTNESCAVNADGRFKCLDLNEQCQRPWCEGPLGSLESNGWVYSAHCAFHIFTQEEAWHCLKGRWLFFWGDSNHQDTIRNLLNFVLGLNESNLGRTFQSTFSNPQNSSEELKITSFFNGHYEEYGNNFGLNSLNSSDYRKTITSYFLPSNQGVPDTVILNSGLHDGKFWPTLSLFAEAVHNASNFWEVIWRNTSLDESSRPRMLFRTTVAPAGESRNMPANPQKMDVFNTILGEELISTFGHDALKIVDAYDMTFPWHYDNMYSDGGHYGRPPSLNSWSGIMTGHQYFVDVMLAHVLLNAICPVANPTTSRG